MTGRSRYFRVCGIHFVRGCVAVFSLEHLAKDLAYRNAVVHLFRSEFFGLPEDGGGGGVIAALDVGAAQVDEDQSARAPGGCREGVWC